MGTVNGQDQSLLDGLAPAHLADDPTGCKLLALQGANPAEQLGIAFSTNGSEMLICVRLLAFIHMIESLPYA